MESTFETVIDFDDDEIMVDFSDVIEDQIKSEEEIVKPNLPIYDHTTREKYRVFRKRKMDPISYMDLDDNYAFKFKYKWDPYTGERTGEDPDGPLYFDPDILIHTFYIKRLSKLWNSPVDEINTGYYEGYYDDGVGCGEEFNIPSRGTHPEWYLFRLPVIDCYLTEDHNSQYITLGPKLTDDEIIEIERLANLRKNNYKSIFGKDRPSLTKMKKLYDISISKTPILPDDLRDKLTEDKLKEYYDKINREAVDSLIKMKG